MKRESLDIQIPLIDSLELRRLGDAHILDWAERIVIFGMIGKDVRGEPSPLGGRLSDTSRRPKLQKPLRLACPSKSEQKRQSAISTTSNNSRKQGDLISVHRG